MGRIAIGVMLAASLAAQESAQSKRGGAAPPEPRQRSEIVLVDGDAPPAAAFGLGNGGIDDRHERGQLQFTDDGCLTPGGVRIECQAAGVKLTFASGCELLFAPDGFLHLRGGESAGPFAGGAELRLGDGALVRVVLNQSQRSRVRDVVVVADGEALQPWRRGWPAFETARITPWPGVRFVCVGDGGDVYRAIALGPLVTLDRVLVAAAREKAAPREHLALLTDPLLASLVRMPRQHTTSDAAVRGAVSAVSAVASNSDELFITGASLQRVERERLRWALRGGYELELQIEGSTPRLGLYAGMAPRPMVEWNLGISPAAFLGNPYDDQPGSKRWYGNGTRLAPVALDLQAREALYERALAAGVLLRMAQQEKKGRGR